MPVPLAAVAAPALATAGRFLLQRAAVPALRWLGQRGASWLAARGGWKGLAKGVAGGLLKGGLNLMGKGLGALGGAARNTATAVAGAAGTALGNAAQGGILGWLASITADASGAAQPVGMHSYGSLHMKKAAMAR